jgi:hypothetical protein
VTLVNDGLATYSRQLGQDVLRSVPPSGMTALGAAVFTRPTRRAAFIFLTFERRQMIVKTRVLDG